MSSLYSFFRIYLHLRPFPWVTTMQTWCCSVIRVACSRTTRDAVWISRPDRVRTQNQQLRMLNNHHLYALSGHTAVHVPIWLNRVCCRCCRRHLPSWNIPSPHAEMNQCARVDQTVCHPLLSRACVHPNLHSTREFRGENLVQLRLSLVKHYIIEPPSISQLHPLVTGPTWARFQTAIRVVSAGRGGRGTASVIDTPVKCKKGRLLFRKHRFIWRKVELPDRGPGLSDVTVMNHP